MSWIKRLFGIRANIEHCMPKFQLEGRGRELKAKTHEYVDGVDKRIETYVRLSWKINNFYTTYDALIMDALSRIEDLDASLSDHDKFYWSQKLMSIQRNCFGDMYITAEYVELFIESDEESMAIWFNTGREFLDHAKKAIFKNIFKTMSIIYKKRWSDIVDSLIAKKYIKSVEDYKYYLDEYIRLIDRDDKVDTISQVVNLYPRMNS